MKHIENKISSGRKTFLFAMIILVFVILGIRMYSLQILNHTKYVGMANANRIRMIPTEAPRGIIYDRNGDIIADNKFQYNINVIPFEFDDDGEDCDKLADFLGTSKKTIKKRIRNNWRGRFLPAKVAEDIDTKTLIKIQEHKLELPGVLYSLEPLRSFPSIANMSHVIGYLREASPEDIEKSKDFKYHQGDLIGWKGIEREYESILRGKRGVKYIQVNAWGQAVGEFKGEEDIPPEPGKDLYLTIDLGLQKLTEDLMKDHPGAIIIMNPDNGEIYSMVSFPDYSPNLFSGIISSNDWNSLINNPQRPLYNRISMGIYPPGSTFKMVATIAALENNIIDPNHTFFCSGKYKLGRREFKCWNAYGHGSVNMETAIEQSCNVYFYNLIRRMDIDLWAKYVALFGFGQKTGIDLPDENPGTLPNSKFLNAKYGKNKWTEGNKLNQVIGQGDVLTTPIQLAKYVSAIATEGKMVNPHLGLKYKVDDTDNFFYIEPQYSKKIELSDKTWHFIEHAMSEVIYAPRGTGSKAKVDGLKVYGKTGTAQNPHGEDHAWFVGWAEDDSIKIAAVGVIEHGGHGGSTTAPIIQKLFEYCKNNKNKFKSE